MPSETESYFDPLMSRRRTLLWTVGTRNQLRRWEVVLARITQPLEWGRNLLEHWDEQMPYFNRWPRPLLTPDLPASKVHGTLNEIEEQVLAADPSLARFIQEPPPSPWDEGWEPVPKA